MVFPSVSLSHGELTLRPIRMRDVKALERELMFNRSWLRQWEATAPQSFVSFDTKAGIRNLLAHAHAHEHDDAGLLRG